MGKRPDQSMDQEPIGVLLQHAGWVRRLAATLVVDAARADDLAQQTLLAALERPPSRVTEPRAWLATVARNLARTFARRDRRRAFHEPRAAAAERLPATDELVAEAALHHAVVGALLALEEPYRSTLLRRFFDAQSPAKLARESRLPVETVRTRLKRGLELLRAELVRRRALPGGVVALVALLDASARAAASRAIASGGAAVPAGASLAVSGAIAVALLLVVGWWNWPSDDADPRDASRRATVSTSASPSAAPSRTSTARGVGVPAQREPLASRSAEQVVRGVVTDEFGSRVVGARIGWLADAATLAESGVAATSDAAGEFSLAWDDSLAAGRPTLDLRVEASTFEPAIWVRARPGDELRLHLRRGIELSGTVRNLAGEPIAGATIRCRDSAQWPRVITAISAADGRWKLGATLFTAPSRHRDSRGPTWIDVSAPDYAPITLFAEDNAQRLDPHLWHLDLWMVRGATVRGEVVDAATGAPIDGADVWLQTWEGERESVALRTTTGRDGHFVLEHLPAWGVTRPWRSQDDPAHHHLGMVCAASEGRGTAQVVLELPEDGALLDVRLELPLLGGVRGRVVDARGRPVEGARLLVAGLAGAQRRDRSALDGVAPAPIRTDAAGRYELSGLAIPPGLDPSAPITARIERGPGVGSDSDPHRVRLIAGQVVEAPDLVVEPLERFMVEVVDEGGFAVEGAAVRRVRPSGAGFNVDGRLATDAAGRCWFAEERAVGAEAPASVVVEVDGFAHEVRPIAPATREMRITLTPERRLHGRVVDADGRPGFARVVVVAADRSLEEFRAAVESNEIGLQASCGLVKETAAYAGEGWFTFRGLGPGPWHVAAFRSSHVDGGALRIALIAAVDESAGDLELLLDGSSRPNEGGTAEPDPRSLGSVELELTLRGSGKPVLRAGALHLRSGDRVHAPRAIAPGRYRFESIAAGSFELTVEVPGATREVRALDVTAGATVAIAVAVELE